MNSTIEQGGRTFRVDVECDEDRGLPWVEHDGHGVISDWVNRDKRAGERVLASYRNGRKMFYDIAETMRIARKDGWGIDEKAIAALRSKLGRDPTRGEFFAEAVRLDFEYCKAYLDGGWQWVGVIVTDITEDERAPCDYGHAVWGFSSEDNGGIEIVANDLVEEILSEREQEEEQERIKSRFRDAMNCGL